MIKISKVLDDAETIGIEIAIDGEMYSIFRNRSFLTGIRIGKFPCDSDGSEFERLELFACEDW